MCLAQTGDRLDISIRGTQADLQRSRQNRLDTFCPSREGLVGLPLLQAALLRSRAAPNPAPDGAAVVHLFRPAPSRVPPPAATRFGSGSGRDAASATPTAGTKRNSGSTLSRTCGRGTD
ncbi:unnamed protein product [Coccothraustes coccothraustes]